MKKGLLFIFLCTTLCSFAQVSDMDSLKRQLKVSDKESRLKTLIELCWEYRFVNADTARRYGMEALNLSRELNLPSLEVEALNNIGITHEAQGNYNEALEYELKALTIRKKVGDEMKTANTLNDIGIIYDEKGEYDKALEYYFEARRTFEKGNDPSKVAMVINNIGIVLKAQKEYKKVVGYYREASAIYVKLKNKFGIAACDANLGSVYFNLYRYDSALFFSQKAAQEFDALNNKQFLAAAVCNMGMAYHQLGNEPEARKALVRAQNLYELYDNKKELASVLVYLAGIERITGNLTKGIELANKGLKTAAKIGAREQVMEARKELSLLAAAANDYRKAFFYYQSFTSIKDSLYESEKANRISELQTKYETEKKENKIELLTQENELKDVRLRQGFLTLAGLVLLILALVALGLLFRSRIKLKQQADLDSARAELRQQQLQAVIASQEEERKRFATDLHDGLGQMISAVRLSISKENPPKDTIEHAVNLLSDMNVEIRNIAFNLMPQALMNEGLEPALQQFAARINRAEGVQISVQAFNLFDNMAAEMKIALYRICQEWGNNVIKYSGSSQISIQLVQHPDELVITIEDNGNGFDKATLLNKQGNGWKNINSRLALIKGSIDIDSQPDRKGTTVVISTPYTGFQG